jgi:hypothetical protein
LQGGAGVSYIWYMERRRPGGGDSTPAAGA